MRHWILAVAAAVVMIASPAWTAPEPALPAVVPADADFVFQTESGDILMYLILPTAGDPDKTRPMAWQVAVFGTPKRYPGGLAEYGASYRQMDCAGGRMRSYGSLGVSREGAVVVRQERSPEWVAFPAGSVGLDAVQLACGPRPPADQILHGHTALIADIDARRAAAK